MTTTVIHVRDYSPGDVYIGRANRYFEQSKWHNPYRIGVDGTREQVLLKYFFYILTRPDLLSALEELRGKRLACWCRPKQCHGDILIALLKLLFGDKFDSQPIPVRPCKLCNYVNSASCVPDECKKYRKYQKQIARK